MHLGSRRAASPSAITARHTAHSRSSSSSSAAPTAPPPPSSLCLYANTGSAAMASSSSPADRFLADPTASSAAPSSRRGRADLHTRYHRMMQRMSRMARREPKLIPRTTTYDAVVQH
ncbi:Os05g0209301, partial [Oryza sativa Japonica Group]